MDREIEHMKDTINKARISGEAELIANREYLQRIVNYLDTLNRENSRLRELCDKYEEEHNTTFDIWKRDMARIEKARAKINNMFDRGDETTIIDDLLELDHILKGDDDEWQRKNTKRDAKMENQHSVAVGNATQLTNT